MKRLITLALALVSLVAVEAKDNNQPTHYEPTWESLEKHERIPEWFKDAKLGIYYHLGPYSVPAFMGEWYARWMHVESKEHWGAGCYQHHAKTYGEDFGYHEFIPMLKCEKFDPDEWADLFIKTGARFAGPMAQHHDGFAMWASKINMWNAKEMGPKRDIMGDMIAALKKRHIYTIATLHHAFNLQRSKELDTVKWKARGSYFPHIKGKYTSSDDPKLKYLYGNIPEAEFNDRWLEQCREVIEGYSPDLVWFDSDLDQVPLKYRQRMTAMLFNNGLKDGRDVAVITKQKDLPENIRILDIEQGGKEGMSEDYWLTDLTISSSSGWCYVNGQEYKSVEMLVRNMIDVWSKRGVVLLNVSPRADGVIIDAQRERLAGIGEWLEKYGEAVYDTRAHSTFGYGDAAHQAGHFGGQSATMEYTESDVRFTKSKDGKALYIFTLGMPKSGSKVEFANVTLGDKSAVKRVSLLGSKAKLKWSHSGDKLSFVAPNSSEMNAVATVFKVEFK
ncbi:MAG: alpha-L-fucosidase [Rikenellaceae bacterium]